MGISFTCENCLRPYRVADSLAGKRVKCKDCGAEIRIPEAAKAVSTVDDDVYGFNDAPSTAPRPIEDDDDSTLPSRPVVSRGSKARRKAAARQPDFERLRPYLTGVVMVLLGYIAHEMTRFGYVLTIGHVVGLPAELQYYAGGVVMLLGALVVLGWSARAGLVYLRDGDLPGMTTGQRCGWPVAVVGSAVLSLIVVQRFASGDGLGGGANPPPAARAPRLVVKPPAPQPRPVPAALEAPQPPLASPPTPAGQKVKYRVTDARFITRKPGTDRPPDEYDLAVDYLIASGTPGKVSFRWMLQRPGRPAATLEEGVLPDHGTFRTTVSLDGAGAGPVSVWLAPVGPEGEPSNAFVISRQDPQRNGPGRGFRGFRHRPPGMPHFPTPPRPPSMPRPPGFPRPGP
jgi:hypothetical protein